MRKRWMIRGVFLVLLALCVGGWGWSYTCVTHVRWVFSYAVDLNTNIPTEELIAWEMDLSQGTIWLCRTSGGEIFDSGGQIWVWPRRTRGDLQTEMILRVLRFAWGSQRNESWGQLYRFVGVPFWFLTILAILALFVFWRKTRMTGQVGGFPVEVWGGRG